MEFQDLSNQATVDKLQDKFHMRRLQGILRAVRAVLVDSPAEECQA